MQSLYDEKGPTEASKCVIWDGTPNIQMSSLVSHREHIVHYKTEEQNKVSVESNFCDDIPDIIDCVSEHDIKLFHTVHYAAKSELPSDSINGLLQLQTMNGVKIK